MLKKKKKDIFLYYQGIFLIFINTTTRYLFLVMVGLIVRIGESKLNIWFDTSKMHFQSIIVNLFD